MFRVGSRVVMMLFFSLVVLGAISMPVGVSAQGNSETAHLCQGSGYLNFTDIDGNGFKNTGQCVRYAAQGGTLVLVVVPELTRCEQAAWDAGYDPANFNVISGTDDDDNFNDFGANESPDFICGFGGTDFVYSLGNGDVFLGGDGADSVTYLNGGIFEGGNGDDTVYQQQGGIFNGGDGIDRVVKSFGGIFNGGNGDDVVHGFGNSLTLEGDGIFNGGEGNDYVFALWAGTFNGGNGDDAVGTFYSGTFNQD